MHKIKAQDMQLSTNLLNCIGLVWVMKSQTKLWELVLLGSQNVHRTQQM